MQHTYRIAGKIQRINFRKFQKLSSIFENIFSTRYYSWSSAIFCLLNFKNIISKSYYLTIFKILTFQKFPAT